MINIWTFYVCYGNDILKIVRRTTRVKRCKYFISGFICICFVISQYCSISLNISQFLSLAQAIKKVSYIVGLTALRLAFLWDLNNTKWCNGFYTEFRQNFTKETFSYDEHLKS